MQASNATQFAYNPGHFEHKREPPSDLIDMHPSVQNLVWLLVLGSAAAGTWYLTREPSVEPEATQSPGTNSLGYYLKGATVVGTDTNGEVLYRIAADRIEEDPDTSRLILSDVEVEYRDDVGVPWKIRASNASGPVDRAYFDMRGNVTIEHVDEVTQERTVIEAEEIHLIPESYFASTDGPVRFRIGDTEIDAVGLKAHLKDDRIDLESDVHAEIRK